MRRFIHNKIYFTVDRKYNKTTGSVKNTKILLEFILIQRNNQTVGDLGNRTGFRLNINTIFIIIALYINRIGLFLILF
jgi:hypothetical protein